MPTIYHRASREMVGTLTLCPPYETSLYPSYACYFSTVNVNPA